MQDANQGGKFVSARQESSQQSSMADRETADDEAESLTTRNVVSNFPSAPTRVFRGIMAHKQPSRKLLANGISSTSSGFKLTDQNDKPNHQINGKQVGHQ